MKLKHVLPAILIAGSVPFAQPSYAEGTVPIEPGALYEAMEQSLSENKFMFVAFLGEGWSMKCKKFKEAVLQTRLFQDFAEGKLVYFPVEARRKPKLSPDETATLQSWVIHFDIKDYPTFILIAPDGEELLRHGYKDIDARAYVQLLDAVLPDSVNQRN